MALDFLKTLLDNIRPRLQKDVGVNINKDQVTYPEYESSMQRSSCGLYCESPLTISLNTYGYTSPVLSSSAVSLENLAECLGRRLHTGTDLELECIVIPSFGKSPPSNVAVKKNTNDFLKGVGDDLKIIQRLIQEDCCKELVGVELMTHFEQVKVGAFLGKLEDQMKRIKITNTDETCKGRKPSL